ncbi:MAG TPA: N-glycosylase/DNA lyase [Candidatus Babeliaceae bacterium]|nr:N-glycosylase/DNA lyase [Candidatus Babeliaceae bacterium]
MEQATKLGLINSLVEKAPTLIKERLQEFQSLAKQSNELWFSELCFCLLTANAQAIKALAIQQELGSTGFLTLPQEQLSKIIRSHGHRFHNKKAEYIVQARAYADIKDMVIQLNSAQAREFLVHNIKGLGYKEASHFLRNVGYSDVAIIDRHILKFLLTHGLIKAIPSSISKQYYLELERLLASFGFPLDLLDLVLWHNITGNILK